MNNSIIMNSDSYKFSHFLYYPENTTEIFSYMESRGGVYPSTVFFGLQGFVEEYLMKPITQEDIDYAKDFAIKHGVPFNEKGWQIILDDYQGYLPVTIKSVDEGSVIPTGNVLATVVNNDPRLPWLTSFIETALLRIWYPCTVATRIFNMKKKIKYYFDYTSDVGNMDFALLDFSSRGCSSYESNKIGGSAYLTLFKGSDSIPAVEYINNYYKSDMSGFSLPATEHSCMTSYGKENEFESFKRIIEVTPENTTVSVVSDTWDIYNACEMWNSLAPLIEEKNITLVVRPDSGNVKEVLPKLITILNKAFKGKYNSKGYKVFDNLKILWGDGINEDTITEVFAIAMGLGISADSILTGSGGGLMQNKIDRDTSKYAFKASNAIINGISTPIGKDPITDAGKASKKGYLDLVYDKDGNYKTIVCYNSFGNVKSLLKPRYCNGGIYCITDLEQIREKLNKLL